MTALTPNVFLRALFETDRDADDIASKVESLCEKHGVKYDSISVKNADGTEAIIASHKITVTDVQSVSGDVLDFEVSIANINGFKQFDHRISESEDYDVDGEELALRLGIEPNQSEGESLGL